MSIQITVTCDTPEKAKQLIDQLSNIPIAASGASAVDESPSSNRTGTATESTASSAAAASAPSPEAGTSPSDSLIISEAVRTFAEENGVDPSTIKGTGAKGRIVKADVKKAIDAIPAPPADDPFATTEAATDDPFASDDNDPFGSDEPSEPTGPTLDGVRTALIGLQAKADEFFVMQGEDEDTAASKAQAGVQKLLKDTTGVESLPAITEAQFQPVLDAVAEMTAKLGG